MSCHVAPDSISELRHVETLRRPAEGLYGLAAFGLFSTCQMLGIPKNVQLSCALQATSHQALPVRKGVILSGRRGPLYYVDLFCSVDLKRFPGCSKRLFNAGWCLWGSSFERSGAAQTVLISAIERVTIPLLGFLLSQILLFACICLYFPTLKAFKTYLKAISTPFYGFYGFCPRLVQ